MIRECRDVQQSVPPQDGLDDQIKTIAHDGQRNAELHTPAVEDANSFINLQLPREFDHRIPIGSDQFDLPGKAFLTCYLSVQPSLFPFTPLGEREGFK